MALGASPNKTLDQFKKENRGLTIEDFLTRHPGPFLVVSFPSTDGDIQAPPILPGGGNTIRGSFAPIKVTTHIYSLARHGDAELHMITVGRTANNDICIPFPQVSKMHAHFQKDYRSGRMALTDAASTNGTRVNGQMLPPREPRFLEDRDRISFGEGIRGKFHTSRSMWALISGQGGPR